ncbi:hypothetical protein Tco_0493579 [Tanacetum coccineum]
MGATDTGGGELSDGSASVDELLHSGVIVTHFPVVIYIVKLIQSSNFEVLTVLDIAYHAILTVLDIVYHAIHSVLDIVYHAILTVLDIVYHAIHTVLDIVYVRVVEPAKGALREGFHSTQSFTMGSTRAFCQEERRCDENVY